MAKRINTPSMPPPEATWPECDEPDVCIHGRGFDVICVECCPEDDDGSFEGDEWSEQ